MVWDDQKQAMRRITASAKLNLPKAASYHLRRELRLQARSRAKSAIANLRQSMAKKRAEIKVRYKIFGYIDWLKHQAEQGDIQAIYALRKRGAVAPALVNITARDLRETKLIADRIAHVTSRGTLFYKAGPDIFRDNGSHISLKRNVSDAGIHAALRIAMVKFGDQPLAVKGSDEFRLRCVEASAKANLPLTFSDIHMEAARKERMHTTPTQRKRERAISDKSIQRDTQASRPNRGVSR